MAKAKELRKLKKDLLQYGERKAEHDNINQGIQIILQERLLPVLSKALIHLIQQDTDARNPDRIPPPPEFPLTGKKQDVMKYLVKKRKYYELYFTAIEHLKIPYDVVGRIIEALDKQDEYIRKAQELAERFRILKNRFPRAQRGWEMAKESGALRQRAPGETYIKEKTDLDAGFKIEKYKLLREMYETKKDYIENEQLIVSLVNEYGEWTVYAADETPDPYNAVTTGTRDRDGTSDASQAANVHVTTAAGTTAGMEDRDGTSA